MQDYALPKEICPAVIFKRTDGKLSMVAFTQCSAKGYHKKVGDGIFTGPVSIVWLHALMQRLHPGGVTKRLPEAYAAAVEVIIYLQ